MYTLDESFHWVLLYIKCMTLLYVQATVIGLIRRWRPLYHRHHHRLIFVRFRRWSLPPPQLQQQRQWTYRRRRLQPPTSTITNSTGTCLASPAPCPTRPPSPSLRMLRPRRMTSGTTMTTLIISWRAGRLRSNDIILIYVGDKLTVTYSGINFMYSVFVWVHGVLAQSRVRLRS